MHSISTFYRLLIRKVFLTLGVIGMLLFPQAALASSGQWTATGNLNIDRQRSSAVLLNNGKALVVGGDVNGAIVLPNSASAELYDPTTETWTQTGSMHIGRTLHTATVLQNGKVLVTGGSATNSVEIYDPNTGVWTQTSNMSSQRFYHTATLLNNGKVLVVGGTSGVGGVNFYSGLNTAELYDPSTGIWTATTNMNSGHAAHIAVQLANGKVLVAGGSNSSGTITAEAELYDPSTDTWTTVGDINSPRFFHAGTLLLNGKVLVAGGEDGNYVTKNSAELFDPSTGSWTNTGSLNAPIINHSLLTLASGKVLRAAGHTGSAYIDYGEVYDPSFETWTATDNMITSRQFQSTTLLSDGNVLMTGGQNGQGMLVSSEIFSVPNAAAIIDSISNVTITQGDTYSVGSFFSDSDSTYWTATVNYGDGSGVQPLALSGMNFTLNHQYNTVGIYTLLVSITDNQGATGTASATITVNVPPSSTLFPTDDSYIKQGSANENEGASTFLRVQSSGHNRSLVRFNESQLEQAVENRQSYTATLRFTITDNGNNWGARGRTIDLHRLTSNWTEGNGFIVGNSPRFRGTGAGTTWNCAVDSNIANQNKNCTGATDWNMANSNLWPFLSIPTETKTITNNQTGIVEFDVTADVQSFMNGTNPNYGWLVKKTNEGQNGSVSFGSKESLNVPKLIISSN